MSYKFNYAVRVWKQIVSGNSVFGSREPWQKQMQWDFPGGTVVKNPPANAGDMGSSPGPGRSDMPQSN